MYEPREDTYLLKKHIKKYAKGDVLEIGTGSGILAIEASKYCKNVTATDIDKKLIAVLKNKYKNVKNIDFIHSDLFVNIKNNKFDLIMFNPPYLPQDKNIKDKTIYGGKEGYEIIEKFIKKVKNYLKKDGKILLLFSSLTNREKINKIINKNNLKYNQIDKQKLFFEELYIYLIKLK